MARFGSFRTKDPLLVYVFDDALVEMQPSTISSLTDDLVVGPYRTPLFGDRLERGSGSLRRG